jgi:hypothetical protein
VPTIGSPYHHGDYRPHQQGPAADRYLSLVFAASF